MKRWTVLIFILAAILCLWIGYCIAYLEYAKPSKNLYPLSAIVEETSVANDTVTIRDYNGNLWQFKGVEDWTEGDICACIFDSKSTPEIKDDEIITVRYSGTVER